MTMEPVGRRTVLNVPFGFDVLAEPSGLQGHISANTRKKNAHRQPPRNGQIMRAITCAVPHDPIPKPIPIADPGPD